MKFTKEQLEAALQQLKDHCLDSFDDGIGEDLDLPNFILNATEVFTDNFEDELLVPASEVEKEEEENT